MPRGGKRQGAGRPKGTTGIPWMNKVRRVKTCITLPEDVHRRLKESENMSAEIEMALLEFWKE